ncbi:MAG: hypothetical protein ABIN97_20900 [Ginsengibacter sp.]
MLSILIPGNIQMDIENYEPLFDLVYYHSSDEIGNILKQVLTQLHKAKTIVIEDKNLRLLSNLSEAFIKMQETPIMLLIEEGD